MLLSEAIIGVVDIETTGMEPPKDQIVELAIVSCSVTQDPIEEFSELFRPTIPIPPEASAVHHLTDEDVVDCNPFELPGQMYYALYAAHNAEFEQSFLGHNMPFVCTYRLALKLWPEEQMHSLQYLRYRFNILPKGTRVDTHRALGDAWVTAFLLKHELDVLFEKWPTVKDATVERFLQWLDEPILLYKCKFGKHEGDLWKDVPESYLGWLVNNFPNEPKNKDLLYTAKYYLGR